MGIVGNNGTGKSTFIKILMGEQKPDSGTLDIGETVRFGYYSQDGLKFDEQMINRSIDSLVQKLNAVAGVSASFQDGRLNITGTSGPLEIKAGTDSTGTDSEGP